MVKSTVATSAQFQPWQPWSGSSAQAMESASTPPIYAKVQVLLERWLLVEKDERKVLLPSIQDIKNLSLKEKDILSMADFAVGIAGHLPEFVMSLGQGAARELLCLLEPIEEKLLPSKGTADWRIWEIFAAAEVQRKQFSVLARYASWFEGESSDAYGLAESPLVMSTEKKLADLVPAFKDVQSQLDGHISSELHSKMTEFTKKLQNWCGHLVPLMRPRKNVRNYIYECSSELASTAFELASTASEIARELRSLPDLPSASPESSEEPGSWSLVEDTATAADAPAEVAGDVGSVASCRSVESQLSYLAGGFMKLVLSMLFCHV